MKTVSIAAIRRCAGKIADEANLRSDKVAWDLVEAHKKIGVDVDFTPPSTNGRATLDFTVRTDPKTIPPSRPRA